MSARLCVMTQQVTRELSSSLSQASRLLPGSSAGDAPDGRQCVTHPALGPMPRGVSEVVADALMSGLKVGCGRISRVVICAWGTQRVTRKSVHQQPLSSSCCLRSLDAQGEGKAQGAPAAPAPC